MTHISRDTHLRDLLGQGDAVLEVLKDYNLACAECLGADFETVGDAVRAHKLNEEEVLTRLEQATLSQG